MKRTLVATVGALALMAFPSFVSAQEHHVANSKKADFHLSQGLTIGTETLKPGDYRFQCVKINGEDVLVVTSEETGREVARIPCKMEPLAKKSDVNELRTVSKPDGSSLLSAVRIKGENVAHRVVMN
jgi:hypothetical protein